MMDGMGGRPLDRSQVLDELDLLATIEHALVVEYLSVGCALGHDLAAEEGGPATTEGSAAAGAAFALATDQMFHLRRVNVALVDAGRSTQLGRADAIFTGSGAEIALGPPSPAQLRGLLDREEAIAEAVDKRYARLRPAVTSDPVFEGDLLNDLRTVIVEDGSGHAAAVAPLRDLLGSMAPDDFLRATRREPADSLEQRLLDLSDRNYRLVLSALQERFTSTDLFVSGAFRSLATSAMEALDDVNRVLVQRGLLPPFSFP